MEPAAIRKRLALGAIMAVAFVPGGVDTGTTEAAVPPGEATAVIRKPPADTAHFAITAPLLPEQATGAAPDDDDPTDDEGPDEPIALWLFLGASLILPVSGIGAGIARRL